MAYCCNLIILLFLINKNLYNCQTPVTLLLRSSENQINAYADFDENQIEEGIPFTWSYTSIPK